MLFESFQPKYPRKELWANAILIYPYSQTAAGKQPAVFLLPYKRTPVDRSNATKDNVTFSERVSRKAGFIFVGHSRQI